MKQTSDERFLLKLYQTAMENGDPFTEIDARSFSSSFKEREIKNIIRHLAQANFIKKIDETTIHLTQHGCDLVLDGLDV